MIVHFSSRRSTESLKTGFEILQEATPFPETIGMPPCPRCSSTQTAPAELSGILSFLAVLLAGFPFMFPKHDGGAQPAIRYGMRLTADILTKVAGLTNFTSSFPSLTFWNYESFITVTS